MPAIQTRLDNLAEYPKIDTILAEYPKIDTIFERKPDFSVSEILKRPVLNTISVWDVTEKIDGTNIRVGLRGDGRVCFGGRTNNAQIPSDLFDKLTIHFLPFLLQSVFAKGAERYPGFCADDPVAAILFGEGYGAGIKKPSRQSTFILYDCLVGGKWWMERSQLADIATKLDIPTVPDLGRMPLSEIVALVRGGFQSRIGSCAAEGIVARPIETLFDRRGERLIFKLKTKDFVPGKKRGKCNE